MFKKIIASLLLVSLFLLASCTNAGTSDQQNSATSKEESSSPVSNTESDISDEISEENSEDESISEELVVPEGYSRLIVKLEELVRARLSPSFESEWNNGDFAVAELLDEFLSDTEQEIEYRVSNMIVELIISPRPSIAQYGYALSDLNNDGVDELLFMSDDGFIHAIFTLCDNKPLLLDAFWSRYRSAILENGDIFTRGSSGAEYSEFEVRNVDKDTCELKTKIFYDYNTHDRIYTIETDGKTETVDRETIDERLSEYPEDFEATNRLYLKENNIKFVNFDIDASKTSPVLFFDGTKGDGKAVVLYAFDENYMYMTNPFEYNGSSLEEFIESESTKIETNIINNQKTLEFFAPDGKSFETAIGDIYCIGEPVIDSAHIKAELKNTESNRYIGTYSGIDIFPDDIEVKENSIIVDIDGDGKKDNITWEFTPASALKYGKDYYFYSIKIKIGEKTLTIDESDYLPFRKEDVEIFVFDINNDGKYDLATYNKAQERFDWIEFYDLSGEEAYPILVYEITPQN